MNSEEILAVKHAVKMGASPGEVKVEEAAEFQDERQSRKQSQSQSDEHRQKNSPSKLPSFRFTDAQIRPKDSLQQPLSSSFKGGSNCGSGSGSGGGLCLVGGGGSSSSSSVSPSAGEESSRTATATNTTAPPTTTSTVKGNDNRQLAVQLQLATQQQQQHKQQQHQQILSPPPSPPHPPPPPPPPTTHRRPRASSLTPSSEPQFASEPAAPCTTFHPKPTHTRKPTSVSTRPRNGTSINPSRPPLTMASHRYSKEHARTSSASNPTTDAWVADQQTISLPSPPVDSITNTSLQSSSSSTLTVDDRRFSRPKISPIRQFKPSRRSTDTSQSHSIEQDNDDTLRALEGWPDRPQRMSEHDEHNSDDSDLFLKMAREEDLARQQEETQEGPTRWSSRRSRIGFTAQRQSMPPSASSYQSLPRTRRDSDHDSTVRPRMEGQEGVAQALTYRPSQKERSSALDDINRSRYYGSNTRSSPTTPRGPATRESREISPESQISYGGRRPSIPDQTAAMSRNSSYRQSNLSYSGQRNYNSSPLVSRTKDVSESPEAAHVVDGTESTTSTTAPSTVWDELEDLKSRIHRLELTGKLPPTSGAAISHASGERPPTATTTVTTMSSSPKRGRGNSISPAESAANGFSAGETHPLLQAALAKSKPLLSKDVYNALEAATLDALAIASMMGTSGQPGPISSSQSTVGGACSVTDRQVRRKADSMCRGLTELCLALSEVKNEPVVPTNTQVAPRPEPVDNEVRESIEVSPASEKTRVKGSPRALSRLEARRSSLLTTSALPSPRYSPSEAGTPTQSAVTGRRTSLFLRPRRTNTEEPEAEDESRFRAPSRATTEIGRLRNVPREYISQQAIPDSRPPVVQSSLPVRRHYTSSSVSVSAEQISPRTANFPQRRFLDRSTPERDSGSVVSRLADDRTQRKSSIGGGFGLSRVDTLNSNRRSRQNSAEPTAGQAHGY
ncbi:LPxTG-motif cell wall anchor domain-containing protein [Phlyctema vagabunda]|uniref:LPxTG-motif cell wall anchor domain-containing protein n=1 Tax=Phlyctema vagabunda TaxID=108571 RepID=A0ABR4PS19_9HELO